MQSWMGDRAVRMSSVWWRIAASVTMTMLVACSVASIQPAPQPTLMSPAEAAAVESVEPYREAGFLVGDGPVPFVGMVRYVGTEMLDTTTLVLALSLPPRALSFVRSGDRYAAYYAVKIDIMSGQTLIRSERPVGEVRVASLHETTRGDEGVIFQRSIRLAPGSYTIRVTTQDSLGVGTGMGSGPLSVPFMANGVIAPMIPVLAAEARTSRAAPLTIVVNPRATIRYGRDSSLDLYVEGYGPEAPDTVMLTTRSVRDSVTVLRRDTIVLSRASDLRSARVRIPISRLGLGLVRVTATRTDGVALGSVAAVITTGIALPLASIDELLDALKYYATETQLQTIRDASPEQRPSRWSAFIGQGDPNPATPDNEALIEYVRRLRVADALYREGSSPGWSTDRGLITAALGEPDLATAPQPADSAGPARVMTWEYRRFRLFLVFADQAGFNRWRLTPASESDFRTAYALAGPCAGCR